MRKVVRAGNLVCILSQHFLSWHRLNPKLGNVKAHVLDGTKGQY
ncbi:hypothetical protein ACVGWK_06925 [Enterobacter sichuanensis]